MHPLLSKAAILRLTSAGIMTAHTVDFRVRDGRFEVLHATKGWRARSVKSLQALGLL